MDHKPVLVSWNHADKLLQPVIKLRDFLKCRRGNNSTVVNSSLIVYIDRDSQPVVSTVGPILRPCMSNLFERPLETIGSRIPFTCRSFHRYTLGDARSHEDAPAPGAVATYGLVSDQSPSAFLESGPARFSEKAIILYFD
jgi:hypothetical protein